MVQYWTFLKLLRAGVSDSGIDIDFDQVDWQWIEDYASKHGVLPIVFDGYQNYFKQHQTTSNKIPTERMLQWYAMTQQAEKHYANHLQAIRTLSDYLAEHGIRTMVLKGYSLSLCYPVPSHRAYGDIDIYQFGDWQKADEVLERQAGIRIDRTHHHHTCYSWNGVAVENHYDFMNQYTHPIHKALERKLKELAAEEEPLRENGILLPSPNVAALFTFAHSMSEWVGESVPLRQVVDWWLLRKHYGDRVDWAKVEAICEELGFGEFLKVWTEAAEWILDADFNPDYDLGRLSANGRRVVEDLLTPEYGRGEGRKGLVWWWFRLRRWFGNRWKMRLAYSKENLTEQFIMHCRSHLLRPERLIQ